MKNKKYLLLLLIIPVIILIGRSFALPFNGEVKTVSIESENYNNAGSFKLEKKVDWEEKGKAKITYNLNTIEKNESIKYKDVILVIDKSNSMNNGKFDKAKNDSIELIRDLLEDLHNRVALISFDTVATIKSDFTNNKEELINMFGSINVGGKANFNNALLKIDELLDEYDYLDNHELIVLFLTDGNPNEGVPNDKATYGMLKDKYGNITINAIQYEDGISIVDGIKNISDNQYIVSEDNVLNEAILTSIPYDKFIITDVINDDHFNINSVDDIKVNDGTVELVDNNKKIVWNLNNVNSGISSKMEVIINLKDEYKSQDGLFNTNKQTIIETKLDGVESNKTSNDTLILSNKYIVSYNLNKPANCDINSIEDDSYFVGDNVEINAQSLYCDGYYIKTWAIKDNENVNYINSNTFIMPSHNVTISAVWIKNGIEKSMDGVVLEKSNTLYRVLQDAAIDGVYAKEYTGPHKDSFTEEGTKAIYHWYADRSNYDRGREIANKYYVKFGDYCWNMIRTTDTGGVRLLYRGTYSEDTKCQRVNAGFAYGYSTSYYSINPSSSYYDYYYGSDYIYDDTTHKFTLSGDVIQKNLSESDVDDYIGWYTCQSTTLGECSTLYKLHSKRDNNYINVIQMRYYDYVYESLGYAAFNVEPINYSLAGIGYMYGDTAYRQTYMSVSNSINYSNDITFMYKRKLSNSYYVADEIEVANVSGSYTYYRLKNPVVVSSISNLSDLKGKYWSSSRTGTFSENRKIGDVDSNGYVYYISAYTYTSNGDGTNSYTYYGYSTIKLGDSITENNDGTYTLNNVIEVDLSDFLRNRVGYLNMYLCVDGTTTCQKPWKINHFDGYNIDSSSSDYGWMYLYYEEADYNILIAKNRNGNQLLDTLLINKYDYLSNRNNYSDYKYTCNTKSSICEDGKLYLLNGGSVSTSTYESETGNAYRSYAYLSVISNKNKFGSDVTWDGTKYVLVDPVEFEVYRDEDLFSHHHFACLNTNDNYCEEVAYVFYYISGTMYYITLKDGEKNVISLVNNMLTENKYDSYIKSIVDEWYYRKMTKYTDYLEDSIYCNNRKMTNLYGWDPNGGTLSKFNSINGEFGYGDYQNVENSIKCEQETDSFSVSNEKAKLKYPTGLLSYNEMYLLGNDYARENYVSWMTGTGYMSSTNSGFLSNRYYGSLYTASGSGYYVVPSITLKYGTEYIDGDGSRDNPYIVDTSEVDE